MRNNHNTNQVLKRAVAGLLDAGGGNYHLLPSRLKEVAEKGLPCEFQFNHLRIRYLTRDKEGTFKLFWLVTNAISGRQRYLYNIDYVSPRGRILWRSLAADMRKV